MKLVVQEQNKVIKLSQKEIATLEKKIGQAVVANTRYDLRLVVEMQKEYRNKFQAKGIKENEEVSKFPHYILVKDWSLFEGGFLARYPQIRTKFLKFFNEEYSNYMKDKNLESEKPIIMIGNYNPNLQGMVLPIIVTYKDKKDERRVLVLYVENPETK